MGLAFDAEALNARFAISLEDAEAIIQASSAVHRLFVHFRECGDQVHIEQKFGREIIPGVTLTGHPDVIAHDGNGRLEIVDFKFGRVEPPSPDSNWQLAAYAILAEHHFEVKLVTVRLLLARLGTQPTAEWTKKDIARRRAGLAEIFQKATSAKPEYGPGLHCRWCPASLTCPALHPLIGPMVHGADSLGDRKLSDLPAPMVAEILKRTMMAKSVIASVEDALKAHVEATGVPIGLGDQEWGPQTMTRREIDPGKGWAALERHCGQFMSGAVSVSVSGAEKAVVENAEWLGGTQLRRGWKAEAKNQMMAALKEVGALTEKSYTQFRLRQKKGDNDERNEPTGGNVGDGAITEEGHQ
jgi:hypothetical protein